MHLQIIEPCCTASDVTLRFFFFDSKCVGCILLLTSILAFNLTFSQGLDREEMTTLGCNDYIWPKGTIRGGV